MNFDDFKKQLLQDPELKKEYDDLAPEYQIVRAMIKARNELSLSQQELARRTGINQSHISRLESGNYNPSLKFLKRIADGKAVLNILNQENEVTEEKPKNSPATMPIGTTYRGCVFADDILNRMPSIK